MSVNANLMDYAAFFRPKLKFIDILSMSHLVKMHKEIPKTSFTSWIESFIYQMRLILFAECAHLLNNLRTFGFSHYFGHGWIQVNEPFQAEIFQFAQFIEIYR